MLTMYLLNGSGKSRLGKIKDQGQEEAKDKSQHPVQKHQTFGIPIKCVDGPCPNQVRFPSGGEWHFTNCKYIYQIGYIIFELNSNGFYKKWSSKCGCVQICPDWWTWNPTNGEWMPVPNSQSKKRLYYFNKVHHTDSYYYSPLIILR
ncbi:hypothetical protein HHI36_023991 [Cryptolaemus montrouzieri]|uniref:Uncharacterized protein n=1 Tax=Cryptolaemus montrouzieri TaxID=559131 RepID=A0ABD2N0W1_9CUCU